MCANYLYHYLIQLESSLLLSDPLCLFIIDFYYDYI